MRQHEYRARPGSATGTVATIVDDVETVLDSESIKNVVIATPAETHYTLVRQALESDRDVFVEKPLALTYEQGAQLVRLADKRKRILMVGHVLEYHPAIVRLLSWFTDGAVGQGAYVYSNRLSLGKVRREENILWSFAPHDVADNSATDGQHALSGGRLRRQLCPTQYRRRDRHQPALR